MANPYFHNRLEDSSGGLVSVYGPNLEKYGTPVFDTGKFGNGLDAQTRNNLLQTEVFNFDLIGKLTEFTVEWWLKPDWSMNGTTGAITGGAVASPAVMCFKQGTYTTFSAPLWWLRFYNNEGLYIESYLGAVLFGPMAITAGNWYKFRVILNASSSVLGGSYKSALYVNNVLQGRSTGTGGEHSGDGKIFVGGFDPANAFADGVVDNVIIYDHATLDYMGDTEYPYASTRRRLRPLIIS